MLQRFRVLFFALLTAMAACDTRIDQCTTEKRVVVFADAGSKCLRQKSEACYKEVAGEAYNYLHNPDYGTNGGTRHLVDNHDDEQRRLFGCYSCCVYHGRFMCVFYGHCRRRDLEVMDFEEIMEAPRQEQKQQPKLRGTRALTQDIPTTPLHLDRLGGMGMVALIGLPKTPIWNAIII